MNEEETFYWIVIFDKDGKVYPYTKRTVAYMNGVLENSYKKSGKYPYLMWVLVGTELEKVEIK